MQFKATNDQMAILIQNMLNASEPVGMGWLQYNSEGVSLNDCKELLENSGGKLYFDYFQGRMVKTSFKQHGSDLWEISTNKPVISYQSWARKYPTVEALLLSAEITEITAE